LETEWALHEGDCIPWMLNDADPASVDMSVFSPPFPSLFSYTSQACDIGNTEEKSEMRLHLGYFYRGLARVLKPGRVAVVHVMQIPRLKRSGGEGLFDFRGLNIRLAERAGLVFEYDWCCRKNPQAQAIRTHSHQLQFSGLERDRAGARGALPDYLLKFRAPGENAVPVESNEVSRAEWIEWAECTWDDRQDRTIRPTNTLNTEEAKGPDDTLHICPLSLGVIRRLIRLYSNPGELVFSPFAGIGSEGYEALMLGRRFQGCEIKPEYVETAKRNFARAIRKRQERQRTMFDLQPAAAGE
jgi:hypothetical protein